MRNFKMLSTQMQSAIEAEVKLMLHASRDCLRNQGKDTTKIRFDCRDGYYGEALGVLRGLKVLGYGDFGSDNVPNSIHPIWNLKWWFCQLEDRTLKEENYGSNNECDHCLYTFGKDAVRRLVKRDGRDVILPIQPE